MSYNTATIEWHWDGKKIFSVTPFALRKPYMRELEEYLESRAQAGETVGVVFVAGGEYYASECAQLAFALGANELVPEEIKEIAVISAFPKEEDTMKEKKRILSYSDKMVTLLDFMKQKVPGTLYPEILFEREKRTGTLRAEGLSSPASSETVQAYSRFFAIQKENLLQYRIGHSRTYDDGLGIYNVDLALSDNIFYDEKASEPDVRWNERKERSIPLILPDAKMRKWCDDMLSILSFGEIERVEWRNVPEEELLQLEPLPPQSGLAWASKAGQEITFNTFCREKKSDVYLKGFGEFIVPLEPYKAYGDYMESMSQTVFGLWKCWKSALDMEDAPFKALSILQYQDIDDNMRKVALNELKRIGKKYSVRNVVLAFLAGVPLQDLFA